MNLNEIQTVAIIGSGIKNGKCFFDYSTDFSKGETR